MDVTLLSSMKEGDKIDLGSMLPFDDEQIQWTVLEAGEGTRKDNNGTHAYAWAELEMHWRGVFVGRVLATEDPSTKAGIRYEARRSDGTDPD